MVIVRACQNCCQAWKPAGCGKGMGIDMDILDLMKERRSIRKYQA